MTSPSNTTDVPTKKSSRVVKLVADVVMMLVPDVVAATTMLRALTRILKLYSTCTSPWSGINP